MVSQGKLRRLRAVTMLALGLGMGSATLDLGTALAQTEEEVAGARAAATEGARAFKEGRWAEAVDFFERAESLVHAPPHLLFQARASVKLGRLVKARELYNKIIREQLPANAPPAFEQAQTDATEEIKEVEPRLARLTITITAPAGVTPKVSMDGTEVAAALIGVPRPVDPGEHSIEVSAEGHLTASQKATLSEGGSSTLALVLEPDPNYAPPAEPVAEPQGTPVEAPSAPAPVATPSDAGADQGMSGYRLGSYISFGVGAVGLAGGVIFTLQSSGKRADADEKFEQCDARGLDGVCREDDPLVDEINTLYDDAGSAQTLATVGYIVGGVGVGAGVLLLLLDPGPSEVAGINVTPWVGYRSVGLAGTF